MSTFRGQCFAKGVWDKMDSESEPIQNYEFEELLEKGVDHFNTFRANHPKRKVNFVVTQLLGIHFFR